MRKALIAALLIAASAAHAEKDFFGNAGDFVEAYHNHHRDNLILRVFIRGVGEGILAHDTWGASKENKQLYCPPPKLALVDDQLVSLMVAVHIAKYPGIKDKPISLVLIDALEEAFLCPEQ